MTPKPTDPPMIDDPVSPDLPRLLDRYALAVSANGLASIGVVNLRNQIDQAIGWLEMTAFPQRHLISHPQIRQFTPDDRYAFGVFGNTSLPFIGWAVMTNGTVEPVFMAGEMPPAYKPLSQIAIRDTYRGLSAEAKK